MQDRLEAEAEARARKIQEAERIIMEEQRAARAFLGERSSRG